MTIRKVLVKDVPQLAKLAQDTYADTFGHTMSLNELQDALDQRSEKYFSSIINEDVILVVENEDQLVGFIQFGKVTYDSIPETEKNIELNKIYIAKDHQGKGIGKKLIEAMLTHDRLTNVDTIYLDVFTKNENAIGLYKKYGFKVIGKTPFIVDNKILGYDLLMKREHNTQTGF